MISLCAAHHLFGIHGGYLRVWGRAPDGLVFELVERPISTDARPTHPALAFEPSGSVHELVDMWHLLEKLGRAASRPTLHYRGNRTMMGAWRWHARS
jgi:hypothetical protein